MSRRAAMVAMVAMACGPSAGTGGDGTSGESDTPAGDASSGGTMHADTSSGGDTETGPAACVLADPSACPDGCYNGLALRVIDDACTTESVEICLPGGPKPGFPTTTFWSIAASGPVFVEYGDDDCGAGAQPETWLECAGAQDEPAGCACFCQSDDCPGDEDRRALDDCGLPTPCGAVLVDPRSGAANHDDERCVLEALRDRVPGVYDLLSVGSPPTDRTRFYVHGDQLSRIDEHADDVVSCPRRSDWSPASRCTLAPTSYFAECLEGAEPGADCVLDLDAWALECTEQPPAC